MPQRQILWTQTQLKAELSKLGYDNLIAVSWRTATTPARYSGKVGAVNAARDYVHVMPSVKRSEDGTFHTTKKDQFGVETNVPLDAAFRGVPEGQPGTGQAHRTPRQPIPATETPPSFPPIPTWPTAPRIWPAETSRSPFSFTRGEA